MKIRALTDTVLRSFLLAVLFFGSSALQAADKTLTGDENIRVTVTRGRSVTDVENGSIGEKLAAFEPVVTIQNASFNSFPGNRIVLLMLGEDTTARDNWKVLYRREFDADLVPAKPFRWSGEPFEAGFDRTLAKSGYDYDGYIVVIKNSEGKPVIIDASKAFWAKSPDKALAMQEGKEYQKSYFKN
jgi:hypothetical protein